MYDIILWGATGFTGRPAARYLQARYARQGKIRWAIAGRDRAKLEAVRNDINAPELDILIVPGGDAAAAERVARSTKVVCATVAPAARLASEMVAACARHGTDYCDLSGELHWLRQMIDTHDATARASGARILNACGFDSIPSDLGVQMLQQEAMARFGEYCRTIKNCFHEGHIAVSGGSFASGKGVMEAAARDPHLAKLLENPHFLNPNDRLEGAASPELQHVVWDRDFGQWIMPFPIGGINARIVRRSHALQDFAYGKNFVYDEAKLAGKGWLNRFKAVAETYVTQLFIEADPTTRFGRMLHGLGPKEGAGPTDEQVRNNGPFSFEMIGKTPSGKVLRGFVYSDWDPGHGGTSAMLCDTAVCLAMTRDGAVRQGGFTTTSVALGPVLREQLKHNAGVEFGIGTREKRSHRIFPMDALTTA